MNYRKLSLALFIASALAVTGCNGELEPDEGSGSVPDSGSPTTPPDTGIPPDSGNPTTPGNQVGTWENKDEDGDGVPDEQDDYPFDKTKSKYTKFEDTEFNNNLSVATPISSAVPFTVIGNVQQKNDTDLYKFTSEADQTITVLLTSYNAEFDPYITIFDNKGESIQLLPTNYKPIGRHKAVGTFSLRYSGDYYLVVNDKDRNGGTDFNYQVSVFTDSDVDGIDDAIESAFGFLPGAQDSDDDRVFDSNEFYVYEYDDVYLHDVDGDGIPNWLDDDSDADGIKDRLEGVFDFDLDGAPSFADLDSDGNGSNDTSDAGGDVGSPKDLDNDGLFDFYDTDDDSDGLLDVNDLEPTVRNKQKLPGEDGYISIYDISYVLSGERIGEVNIAGEAHSLSGNGFTDNGMLVFDMGADNPPINISVNNISASEILFKLPRLARSVYYNSASGNRSNALPINYVNQRIPIVQSLQGEYYQVGDIIEVKGVNFFSDTKVFIDDQQVDSTIYSEGSLSFVLPDITARKSKVSLLTSYGKSNEMTIKIGRKIELSIDNLPIDNVESFFAVSAFSPNGERATFTKEKLNSPLVVSPGYDVAILMYSNTPDSRKPYLFSTVFSDTKDIDFTYLGSAVAEVFYYSDMNKRLPQDKLREFHSAVSNLSEVIALAKYITDHSANPGYQDDDIYDSIRTDAVNAAIEFSRNFSVSQGQANGKNKKSMVAGRKELSGSSDGYSPDIVVDWDEYEDVIDVYPTKKWDNFGDLVFDGNLGVDNDTGLFLSAQFNILGNESIAFPHIDSWFHADMIGPQDWGVLNLSVTKEDYKQCNYHDCIIEVVTPGFTGNQPVTDIALSAQELLLLRTSVEQIILPAIGLVLGDDDLIGDRKWVASLLEELYPSFKKAIELSQQKTPIDITQKFLDIVVTDLLNANGTSKLISIIAQKLGTGDIIEVVVKRIAQYVAPLAVPVAGEIAVFVKLLHDLLMLTNTFNQVANTAYDLINVPGLIRYEVKWPVFISATIPAAINKKKLDSDVKLIIEGGGFLPVDGFLGEIYPEVQVIDTKGTEDESDDVELYDHPVSMSQLVNDGSKIDHVMLESEKLKAATGPLRVFVEVSDSKVYKDIEFFDGIKITSVHPDKVFVGREILIDGVGFSSLAEQNIVTFQGVSTRIKANVISAGESRLKVIVPDGAVTGELKLTVNGTPAVNSYPITVVESGITIRFGDNGNDPDDIFTVSIDGKSLVMQTEGQRAIELNKTIAPGEYTVIMNADTVPDARGTYYVCFSDNVEVLNGSPLTSKTLLQKTNDKASWTVKVSPGRGDVISQCSQGEIQPNATSQLLSSGIID
ncbi:IPT/TIG domain-containing protein [Shewanella sp. 3B26]|uniref:IPT/TIG domain-containing protein n=1 Tax=Shewanella zhuhaiensis TaxID=2919576 RepID=A0AAJ1BE50_9GAMM|nr:IPT/TIG domain-containing protein [Shewanella zhuhaiensis]MCH4293097.1 IPT/TIG domain-containing protein [Shewanella zhuhaiensis]